MPIARLVSVLLFTFVAASIGRAAAPGLLWVPGTHVLETGLRLTPVAVAGEVQKVVVGNDHTLYLKTDGTLWATGGNASGQLGDGTTTDRSTPVQIATGVASVTAAQYKTFFIKTDGTLWAMGWNISGSLGNGADTTFLQLTPVQIATDVLAVEASYQHTLFLKHDGTVWAMGSNTYGQLGLNPTTYPSVAVPVQVATNAAGITVQDEGSFVVKTDGTLWAMGRNAYGQMGTGNTTNVTTPTQVATNVAAVSASIISTLFIKNDGTLWAMGKNDQGQLTDGTTTDHLLPVAVQSGISQVRTTGSTTFLLKTDHTLWGVGNNGLGLLGDGTNTNRPGPVPVAANVASVQTSWSNTYFLKLDGSLWGTGINGGGQLGDGTTTGLLSPRQIATSVGSFASGQMRLLYLTDNLELFGVGLAFQGQLGDGTVLRARALRATDVTSAEMASGNVWYTKSDGTLWSVTTGQTAGISDTVAVSVDDYDGYPVYLRQDGSAWQLSASGSTQLATGVAQVFSGYNYRLFLKTDGSLWGLNTVTPASLRPVFGDGSHLAQVATGVVSVSASADHFLFVKDDHSLWGQGLMPGGWPTPSQPSIEPVQLETDVLSASAHTTSNTYLKTDGHLWVRTNGWGPGSGVAMEVATDVAQGTAGYQTVFYIKSDGSLFSRAFFYPNLGPETLISDHITRVAAGTFENYVFIQEPGGAFPSITVQPQSAAGAYGTPIQLEVTASGGDPLDYQWYKDGIRLPHERSPQLRVPYALGTDRGAYTVKVTNRAGSVTSAPATITVPFISQTITFWSPKSGEMPYGIEPIPLDATTNGDLPVTFTVLSGPATISSGKLLLSGTGTVVVRASQAGNGIYKAASNVDRTFTITEPYLVTTLAGHAGRGNVDGTGPAAQFNLPNGLAVDSAGNVYVADTANNTVRKVTPAGVVTTLAGNPAGGHADGTGSAASFWAPAAAACDGAGNVYVRTGYHTILKITPAGVVTTLAGQWDAGHGSADGTGSAARFYWPYGLAADSAGNVYVADTFNHTIRKITADGVVTTLAGSAGNYGSTDGTGSTARFYLPYSITLGADGNLYVADSGNNTIRKVTIGGEVTTLAGDPAPSPAGAVDGTGQAARFNQPQGVTADGAGNLYVADSGNHTIRRIVLATGGVTTFAGSAGQPGLADGTGSTARFNQPWNVAADAGGNLYVIGFGDHQVRKITAVGVVSSFAGQPANGSADGAGAAAQFATPDGVALDAAGNVYVADTGNHLIRKVAPDGTVSTFAGSALEGGSADGVGNAARFNQPYDVAVDQAGNVYVADLGNSAIRKITPARVVTTFATGISAPTSLALDAGGNLYVIDSYSRSILKITPAGITSVFAGTPGSIGLDDGPVGTATFWSPSGIAVDGWGYVYVTDSQSRGIRKITPEGVVSTPFDLGDMGVGLLHGIAVDGAGYLYIIDSGTNLIHRLDASGNATTIMGGRAASPLRAGAFDGLGNDSRFYSPQDLAVDGTGTLYIADTFNSTIRKAARVPVLSISSQPTNQTATIGTSASFTVGVSGSPSRSYQWRKNGANITGANASNYSIGSVAGSDAAVYSVVVFNEQGMVTSAPALLTIQTPVTFSAQPASQVVSAGHSAVFGVTATGTGPFTYQWQMGAGSTWQDLHDDAEWSGTMTTATLTIADWAVSALNGVQFRCIVSNASGSAISNAATLTVRTNVADFNGDGQSDILWRNTVTHEVGVWLMNGTTSTGYQGIVVEGGNWLVIGTGDFNHDGQSDIIWRNTVTHEVGVWLMNGTTSTGYQGIVVEGGNWTVIGTGDFNHDGQSDLIWRNTVTHELGVWLMNGTTSTGYQGLVVEGGNWLVIGTGDFNHDGQSDLVWRNSVTHEVGVWLMNGTTSTGYQGLVVEGGNWTVIGTGDFNHDGQSDIIWRNIVTHEVGVWLMNGATSTGYQGIVVEGGNWMVINN